jgi:hypothetical protein
MKAAEFVSRLIELATARGADAGPFNDYASSSGHLLEIYVHAGDEYHQSPGVYVWEAGCSEPNRIEPQAFDSVLSHVEALPINLEDHSDPADGVEWPGASVFVWRAIMDGIDAAGVRSAQSVTVQTRTFRPIGVLSAEQHANLASAGLCACAECAAHDAIDGTITAIAGPHSIPSALGDDCPAQHGNGAD